MILVDNYIGAILCCVYCCLCWGSWANTQKMVTSKSWSFELFYWDLTFGLFFTALLGALTLGNLGSEGRTFFEDLAVMDWNSMKYALLGGIVWNFGNIFLTAAIAVAGMSVGFPIGGGLAWIGLSTDIFSWRSIPWKPDIALDRSSCYCDSHLHLWQGLWKDVGKSGVYS